MQCAPVRDPTQGGPDRRTAGRWDRTERQARGSVVYSTPQMYCTVRSTWQE
jgi:hypothetical protein